jgi:hypothetical protein
VRGYARLVWMLLCFLGRLWLAVFDDILVLVKLRRRQWSTGRTWWRWHDR